MAGAARSRKFTMSVIVSHRVGVMSTTLAMMASDLFEACRYTCSHRSVFFFFSSGEAIGIAAWIGLISRKAIYSYSEGWHSAFQKLLLSLVRCLLDAFSQRKKSTKIV